MKPFIQLSGVAAPMVRDNIDTDAIIPSRETQSTARTGYGEKLFANWRYSGGRVENPDFVLNREPYRHAVALVSGRNFGCGSSREAAVWSLVQFGIRCVIAESFGNIFRNNCIRNGLLPVVLDEASILKLEMAISDPASGSAIEIDLVTREVRQDGQVYRFTVDPGERTMLLEGLDEIELTLKRRAEIAAFADRRRRDAPWVSPVRR